MNTDYLLKTIRPFVKDNQLTYDDFEKIFGILPLKEQYPIAYAIQDDLKIELKNCRFARRKFCRSA